jgi:hypothetical protein
VRWLKDLFLTSKGLMIGDARLYGKRDASNNFDPYWKRKDGTDVNLTGETLLARATSSLTLTTSFASITGGGDSGKVRILLPTIGEWKVDATALLQQTGANDPGLLHAALFVNDSGTEEDGNILYRPRQQNDQATPSQRWKITTTAADTPVELKSKMSTGGGNAQCISEHTTLSASIGAGGGSTVEAADHGTLSGLGDDDHTQYGQLADAETAAGVWTFTGGLKFDETSTPAAPSQNTLHLYVKANGNNIELRARSSLDDILLHTLGDTAVAHNRSSHAKDSDRE